MELISHQVQAVIALLVRGNHWSKVFMFGQLRGRHGNHRTRIERLKNVQLAHWQRSVALQCH